MINPQQLRNVKLGMKLYIKIAVVLIALMFLWSFRPIRTVPTGFGGVVTRLGAIVRSTSEGPAWVWPWEEMNLFNLRAQEAKIQNAEGGTSDTQPVFVSLTVRYAITPARMAEVFEKYTHNGDLSSNVDSATQEVFRSVTANYTATDLIAKRTDVSKAVRALLDSKLSVYGAHVISIDMTGFSYQKSYMDAIIEKVTQEQKRQAADNKLKTVESEQKQKVAIAEAEATAAQKTADGQAYAVTKAAEAEAQAIRVKAQALAQNKDLLELRRIEVEAMRAEKWDGKLPQTMYGSAPIPFLNAK